MNETCEHDSRTDCFRGFTCEEPAEVDTLLGWDSERVDVDGGASEMHTQAGLSEQKLTSGRHAATIGRKA